jgi:hypothetical protein
MTTGGDQSTSRYLPIAPTRLDEQMTIAQLVEQLEALHFDKCEQAKILLDPGVQSFLLAATKAAAANHLNQKVRHTWRLIRPPR